MTIWPAALIVLAAQSLAPSPHQLARATRALEPAEISAVLQATRAAIANKTFILAFPGFETGPEVLIGADGRPRITRMTYGLSGGVVGADGARSEWRDDFVDIVVHSGAPAARCDGSPVSGELVITYQHRASTDAWTAFAATTPTDMTTGAPGLQVGQPIFDLLAGDTPVVSVERRTIDGPSARAFTGDFVPPAHSARGGYGLSDSQAAARQTLWIDVDSLLPLRWEVSVVGSPAYVLLFNYRPLDLRPPDGIEPPHCIS